MQSGMTQQHRNLLCAIETRIRPTFYHDRPGASVCTLRMHVLIMKTHNRS